MNDSIISLKLVHVYLRRTLDSLFKKCYSYVQMYYSVTKNDFDSLLLARVSMVVNKCLFGNGVREESNDFS